MTLADLPVGTCSEILGLDTANPAAFRLLDLGFVPGTPVTVIRRAPLGGSAEVMIRGYRLGLRRDEATLVQIVAPREKKSRKRR